MQQEPHELESGSVNDRAEQIRLAAQRQWSHDPAGAIAVGPGELGTPQSFADVERHRYAEQPWMQEVFRYQDYATRRVLEIGVGLGTDHLQFARAGAKLSGIDLTPRCIDLTQRRFEQEGLQSHLRVMDAERLDFPDDSFDAVYSFGVLHHTPSAERAFAEIRRVLRPGGVFVGGLYNRWSVFTAVMLLQRLRRGEWRHETWQQRLSRVEHSTAEDSPAPFVRLFGSRELRHALRDAGFHEVEIVQRHLGLKLNRQLPTWLERLGSEYGGWYLIHRAC